MTRLQHRLMTNSMDVPVIDLALLGSDPTQADEMVRGFSEYGLIYIRNHGLDQEKLSAFYETFSKLLERDEAEKNTWRGTDVWYQRGWTPPNTEQAVVAGGQPDFKECFFIQATEIDEDAARYHPQIYAQNIWPENAESYRELYVHFGKAIHNIGMQLLQGCARAFGLDEQVFSSMCDKGPHVTRALRYIPLDETQVNTDIVWGEEHTDFNLLTLLPGGRFFDPSGAPCAKPDPESGLYLRARATEEHPQGRKVQGIPPEGCMVAQVGQQFEILTGGKLLATPHVITPPKQPGYSRTAMAHFIHAHTSKVLFPLEQFQTEQSVRAYGPPVLAGTYDLKTLVDIALAPKDSLNLLGYHHYDRLATQREEE